VLLRSDLASAVPDALRVGHPHAASAPLCLLAIVAHRPPYRSHGSSAHHAPPRAGPIKSEGFPLSGCDASCSRSSFRSSSLVRRIQPCSPRRSREPHDHLTSFTHFWSRSRAACACCSVRWASAQRSSSVSGPAGSSSAWYDRARFAMQAPIRHRCPREPPRHRGSLHPVAWTTRRVGGKHRRRVRRGRAPREYRAIDYGLEDQHADPRVDCSQRFRLAERFSAAIRS
jgi:hypothetical protein